MRVESVRGALRAPGRSRRRGAAAVELALVLPVIIAILFAALDLGRAIMVMQLLSHAAQAGVRPGVLPGNGYGQIKSAVGAALTGAGISGAPDPTVAVMAAGTSTWVPASAQADTVKTAGTGDAIKVTVNVPYGNVAWVTGFFMDSKAVLSCTTVMAKE